MLLALSISSRIIDGNNNINKCVHVCIWQVAGHGVALLPQLQQYGVLSLGLSLNAALTTLKLPYNENSKIFVLIG